MPTAHEFAAAAERMCGVRWRRHGRDPAFGLDCAGIAVAALAAIGITAQDSRDYDAGMPPPELLWRLCRENGEEVPWTDQGEGRVALCRWSNGDDPRHLVVMLARRRIAHVDASLRRVTVVPAGWLDSRLVAVFRARGVEYAEPW
ncbi:MAG: hypothetical protein JNK15_23790 [Planctomycetes bacterium]|nr:hypothetical protein [Planctomycetota bacterium]